MASHLEIVDDTFPIEVIVSNRKEVPIEGFAPRIFLLGRLFSVDAFDRKESSDLAVYRRLTEHDEQNHVSMTEQE